MTEETKNRVETVKKLRELINSDSPLTEESKSWIKNLMEGLGGLEGDSILQMKIEFEPTQTRIEMYSKLDMIISDLDSIKTKDIIVVSYEGTDFIIQAKNVDKDTKTINFYKMLDPIIEECVLDESYELEDTDCYIRKAWDYEKMIINSPDTFLDSYNSGDPVDLQDALKELKELDKELGDSIDEEGELSEEEGEILKILGDNETTCRVIEVENEESESDNLYGIYTYENRVYVINDGCDTPFWMYSEEFKEKALELINEGKFCIDESF